MGYELILEQFVDVLVKILLLSAIVSFLLAFFDDQDKDNAAYVEPIVILAILIINAFVGVWKESNAEAALEALKDLQLDIAHCRQNGRTITIPAHDLVPGDVVLMHTEDKFPAGIRITSIKSSSMRVEQSQLMGESESVEKFSEMFCFVHILVQRNLNRKLKKQ